MFGLTIWHALCIAITLLWLITAYRLHVSKHQGNQIKPKVKVTLTDLSRRPETASKCIFIVGGPGEGGSTGGSGGDSGSC